MKHMTLSSTFIQPYNNKVQKFLDHSVIGDETRTSYSNVETRKQIHDLEAQWFAKKPKSQTNFSWQKANCYYFLGQKRYSAGGSMNPRAPVTLEVYCEMLKQLRRAIQNRWHGLLFSGVVLLHDNMRSHTAVHRIQLQKQFQWELFNHLLYSPDLVPSDFHLFLHLKTLLAWLNFTDGKELK